MMAAKVQALHDKAQAQQASDNRTAELSERIDVLKVRYLAPIQALSMPYQCPI